MIKSAGETFRTATCSSERRKMNPSFQLRHRCAQLALVACIALTGCATQQPEPKLFDRLGGLPAITAVVDKTLDSAAHDPRTGHSFDGVKLEAVKRSVVAQICEATGGPCKYKGDSIYSSEVD